MTVAAVVVTVLALLALFGWYWYDQPHKGERWEYAGHIVTIVKPSDENGYTVFVDDNGERCKQYQLDFVSRYRRVAR